MSLLEKWAPVLEYSSDSVKPIEDDHTRLNTAILLENQEKWCIEEGNYRRRRSRWISLGTEPTVGGSIRSQWTAGSSDYGPDSG